MKNKYKLRVGLFGIGLEAYWAQFDGLKDRLTKYLSTVEKNISQNDIEIVNLGLIDSPEKAVIAGHDFRRSDVDIIFLYVATYALSSTVLPVVQRAKVPVIILNLQPEDSIDYKKFNALEDRTKMTGIWLGYCNACPVPEIANVFNRCGISFYEINGVLDAKDECWKEVKEWVEAAKVANVMRHNRLGLMGHYYNGMVDVYTDITLQLATFGGHMEIFEVDELSAIRKKVSKKEIANKVQEFKKAFDIQKDCSQAELERAAITSVALDKLVDEKNLGSMAYYYMGSGIAENEDTLSSIILGNSLLNGKGITTAGEYEVKTAQAMKILDSFGVGGSFTEYVTCDFKDDVVLLGHDGPGHIKIAEGKIKVRPLKVYHGKVGKGLSVEMSVKAGDVTLLSVIEQKGGKLALLCAEGKSEKGDILEIGNTNSRYRFSIGAREFMKRWNKEGPAHHCAIGVGHIYSKLEKLAALLDIEIIKVC